GRDVASGRITLGDLVAFNGYLGYLAWPTVALGLTLSVVRRGLTSMERIQEIVTAARPAPGDAAPLGGPPSLAFERLTWGYPARGPALRDVTFAVAPGEMVAVVGPTGAGKSTLGLLLARLWEPPAGTVFVGGRDVTTLPLATLRATVGWVPQEALLFSRSIADNITLGRAGLDVVAAAQAAHVAAEVRAFPTATPPSSASAASPCRAASGSGWRSRARWRAARRSWSSTTSLRAWTPRPRR